MNNNNNNNDIEIWNNANTITINIPNSGEPYNTTTDAFFLDQFPIHGAGNLTNDTVGGLYRKVFKKGPVSVSSTEECPICMETYKTEDANNGEASFPDGFDSCPVKFLCGFICCYGCLCDWIDEKGTNHWTCFSCRASHTSAIFLRVEEPTPISVTLRTPAPPSGCNCHETTKEVFDALEASHTKIERLERENERLRKQVAILKKRKLEPTVSSNKKVKLFPSLEEDDKE